MNATAPAIEVVTIYSDQQQPDLTRRKMLAWVCVSGLHASVLLIAGFMAWRLAAPHDLDVPPFPPSIPVTIVVPPVKPPVDKPPVPDDTLDTVVESDVVTPTVVTDATDDVTSTDDVAEANDARGKPDAVSEHELGDVGVFTTMGVGGPPAGMFSNRVGVGKKKARMRYLGPIGRHVDIGINSGLSWLKKHQSPTGQWSAATYFTNCQLGQKCEPGKDQAGDTDVAMTSYALMCFVGFGYDHKTPSLYRPVCKHAIEWLITKQADSGRFGARNYEHAIATQALAEIYAMTNDATLLKPLNKAITVITQNQAQAGQADKSAVSTNSATSANGLGWDYEKANLNRIDTSVSGWNVMALKSALGAGINVVTQLKGAEHWIDAAWKSANPAWKSLDQYKTSVFPYCWNGATNAVEKDTFSAVAATCLVFLGRQKGDVAFESLLKDAETRWLAHDEFKTNLYHTYYLAMAEFEADETHWLPFRDKVIPHLVSSQRQGNDCLTGSFDAAGQNWPGADTGRVLSTCYSLLTLEVAYRYTKRQ